MKQRLNNKKTNKIEALVGIKPCSAYASAKYGHFWAEVWFGKACRVFIHYKTGEIEVPSNKVNVSGISIDKEVLRKIVDAAKESDKGTILNNAEDLLNKINSVNV